MPTIPTPRLDRPAMRSCGDWFFLEALTASMNISLDALRPAGVPVECEQEQAHEEAPANSLSDADLERLAEECAAQELAS